MVEYRVISDQSRTNLETTVNARLAEGWKLAGGISVCSVSSTDLCYAQAMTRDLGTLTVTSPSWKVEVNPFSPDLTKPTASPVLAQMNSCDRVWMPVQPEPTHKVYDEESDTWSPVIPEWTDIHGNPVAPQSKPKTDREKLVDVLTEIGIDFKQNGDRIDIAHDWMIKGCDYTAVLFKPDGSYYRMT